MSIQKEYGQYQAHLGMQDASVDWFNFFAIPHIGWEMDNNCVIFQISFFHWVNFVCFALTN